MIVDLLVSADRIILGVCDFKNDEIWIRMMCLKRFLIRCELKL
jgi:hypothetical protein